MLEKCKVRLRIIKREISNLLEPKGLWGLCGRLCKELCYSTVRVYSHRWQPLLPSKKWWSMVGFISESSTGFQKALLPLFFQPYRVFKRWEIVQVQDADLLWLCSELSVLIYHTTVNYRLGQGRGGWIVDFLKKQQGIPKICRKLHMAFLVIATQMLLWDSGEGPCCDVIEIRN